MCLQTPMVETYLCLTWLCKRAELTYRGDTLVYRYFNRSSWVATFQSCHFLWLRWSGTSRRRAWPTCTAAASTTSTSSSSTLLAPVRLARWEQPASTFMFTFSYWHLWSNGFNVAVLDKYRAPPAWGWRRWSRIWQTVFWLRKNLKAN